jgi:predicted nucleic acid-binding protein
MLQDNDSVYSRYFDALSHGNTCVIPLIVYYEVRRVLKANGATRKMYSFEKIRTEFVIDDLTVEDMDTAANIYADRKSKGVLIDDADLLIAAQCITRGYTLVTHNARHFEGIDSLRIEDWVS